MKKYVTITFVALVALFFLDGITTMFFWDIPYDVFYPKRSKGIMKDTWVELTAEECVGDPKDYCLKSEDNLKNKNGSNKTEYRKGKVLKDKLPKSQAYKRWRDSADGSVICLRVCIDSEGKVIRKYYQPPCPDFCPGDGRNDEKCQGKQD